MNLQKTASIKIILLAVIALSLVSKTTIADDRISNNYNEAVFRLFSTYESNGKDYIKGIGFGTTFKNSETNLGMQFNTSLNNAVVLATDGYLEEYLSWQGSAKFGLFSNVSVYGEVGVDLTELFFHDWRYDDDDFFYDEFQDDVDFFVGVGAGLQAGQIRFEGFVRLREIDSKYWEAESEVFSGFQFSIEF